MTRTERDIPIADPDLSGNERKYLLECIDTGWISSRGQFVKRLEGEFARYLDISYAEAVSSGTSGLHLALLSLGVKTGDEVLVPSLTFIASVNAVKYVGATPVFVDSEPITWNMDVEKLEKHITKRTKAIIPVHLYGHPVDMDPLLEVAKKHNLYVIEDAAEAAGAEYKGKKAGSLGDIGVFSLFANKIITSGEGGIVVTNNKNLDQTIRIFRDQGLSEELRAKSHYLHSAIGYNYDMSNLQAAIAVAQLERIEGFVEKKRWVAEKYTEALGNIPGITISSEHSWARSNFWMFSIVLGNELEITRDEFIHKLKEEGIDSRPFFYPIHTLEPYRTEAVEQKCDDGIKVASWVAARGINLPSSVKLTEKDIYRVAEVVKQIVYGSPRKDYD